MTLLHGVPLATPSSPVLSWLMRRIVLQSELIGLLLLTSGAVQGGTDLDKRVDDIFQQWSKPGTPGAAVAVIQSGKIVCTKGYGLANLEYDIPVTPQTIYHVASVSKQFTAMALVLLEQDGKLSIEDDVHKYLRELPEYGTTITIRQLLQHTSGIRDQWQTLAVAGWRLDDVITQQQILRMLFRQKELNFAPGTKHLYSNGGYSLAAEIVARVAGTNFPAFCEARIFRPLGMTRTHFHDDHRRIVHDRAYSYGNTAVGYEASPLNYANVGATSLFTTAEDLVKWLDNFREPKVGGSAGVARLQEQAVLADGKKIDYALGVALGKHRGLKTISHSGGDAGYRSHVLWFPEEKLGIAVVSGLASFDTGGIAAKVADVYLEGKGSPETPEPPKAEQALRTYITLESKVLDLYIGHYLLDVLGVVCEIRKKDGKLVAEIPTQPVQELKALATNRFYLEAAQGEVRFTPEGDGMRLRFTGLGPVISGERITLDATPNLAEYQGAYWSDELQTQYTLVLKADRLIAEHVRHGEITLTATAKDCFVSKEWFMPEVRFRRDSTGRVVGLTIGGGRVAGIRFDRK
jgi:CubicO group peptidase (beta-lactamase class C family)